MGTTSSTLTLRLALLATLAVYPVSARSGALRAYPSPSTSPLSILNERGRSYPGSALTVRQTLKAARNSSRQVVVSYQSDGLRINALLTVPNGTPPRGGWPAIVFTESASRP